jgi:hypothetical protein
MEQENQQDKYQRARDRVDELKKFYGNLTSYVLVIIMLAVINYLTFWGYKWFLWAAFGWGIGLVFHAARTFRWNPFFSKDWEDRQIRKFMEEDEQRNRRWE